MTSIDERLAAIQKQIDEQTRLCERLYRQGMKQEFLDANHTLQELNRQYDRTYQVEASRVAYKAMISKLYGARLKVIAKDQSGLAAWKYRTDPKFKQMWASRAKS